MWHGFGVAVGSMIRVRGRPDIMGRVWCSHTLKQLAAQSSLRWSSNLPLFASVAGNGRVVGRGGGWALVGHEQVLGVDCGEP